MATKLAMTVSVKTMDTHRWVCRTHLLPFMETSSEEGFTANWSPLPGQPPAGGRCPPPGGSVEPICFHSWKPPLKKGLPRTGHPCRDSLRTSAADVLREVL